TGTTQSGGSGSGGQGSGGNTSTTRTTTTNGSGGAASRSGSGSNTLRGTADQLHAAVQQMIQQGKTPSKKLTSNFSLYTTQATLPQPQQQQGQGQQQGQNGSQQQTPPTIIYPSPMNDQTKLNTLLPQLLDVTTPRTTFEVTPRVNVNTAPPEV